MIAYTLPELPFGYAALEPHVSKRILELHHREHHAAYVKQANATIEQLAEARTRGEHDRLASLERALAFNLSGHVLHSLFWQCLTPKGGGRPSGELARQLDRNFGSFETFRKQMNQAAATIMGSGWAALVWEPLGEQLLVTQIYDHQANLALTSVPLLVIDAWEHAYYPQYENRKAEFFDALWNVWDWPRVALRFAVAKEAQVSAKA